MPTKNYLLTEFFLLFVVLPVSFALPYAFWIKAGLTIAGFVYIVFILKRSKNIQFRVKKHLPWNQFWKRIGITFLCVIVSTTLFVYFTEFNALFFVPRNHPGLFVLILLIYTFLSVWPQEIIYRTFFFERYELLFQSKALLVFINAIIFSLAHLFFRNTLVLVLTFIGGLIFGTTYLKYRSTTLVSIEHALYGNWLFTVGMGQMLAFPGMEA
ncbi:CPBP family intramembrane glutamic endopeptidase [Cochleicola gelatinilyticus]|uniref:Abortive infection protein n=1 Tax=Cochleicola gelatinilyticus TaxID=1763537 RepID=A0A167HJY5_9FLAO|nr:CPBP family intramembrane glutamic endopeptidase [Cochleicola gelatinilyticus]OAB78692.1 abortive infection protein [Cochleicola gelatinilyticus]